LIRAECSMISAQGDPKRQVRTGMDGIVLDSWGAVGCQRTARHVGALRLW
jgi:hypothetical protein